MARFRPLILPLLLISIVALAGCENGGFRSLDAVEAERQAMQTTRPYADAYIEKYPDERQSVEDFYAAWEGRLNKEAAAATPGQ